MSQKQYWKGLEGLNRTAEQKEAAENEFAEELPFDLSSNLLEATTPRRDFLKFLGFSTLAATLVASCEMPVRKAIPYAIKPEDIVPGVPNYYASTFTDGGDYCAIIIKTRDGRPIKVEGNPLSSVTMGGTSARVQASVLNLYDKARLRYPGTPSVQNGKVDYKESTYTAIDRMIMDALKASTLPAYILTSSILSPTTKDIIAQFIAKYPNTKHVVYDAVSYSGMLLANEACYGKRTLPTYHFDKAQTIVSLGADFLGTWLSPIEFTKGYSKGRKISAKDLRISKHYHIEANHTITGANADHRVTCKPSEIASVALALYSLIANGIQPSLSKNLNELVNKAAADLKKGNGLVVCGSNDVAVQTIINTINEKIGANGTTINWAVTSNYRQGIDADMVALVEAMNAGQVGALMMQGVNPVYDYYDAKKFEAGLSKVPLTVSFAERMDETAQKCKYITPDHHYLESWGDAEPKPGYYSLQQPGIAPLFKTRAFQDSLLAWTGATGTYGDYWKQFWMTKMGSQENFDKALQDGIIEPTGPMAIASAPFAGDIVSSVSKIQAAKSGSIELLVYQNVSMGYGGAWSNNPWLLEMPDPITRATWDNYVCISPKRAQDLGAELTGQNEVETKKHVVKVKSNNYEVLLPLVVVPGMHNDVIAIAVGYGRDANVGRAAASDPKTGQGGKNAYPFVTYNGQTFDNYNTGITIEKTDQKYDVAIVQTHMSYEARPIVHEYTLEEFSNHPDIVLKDRRGDTEHFSILPWEGETKEGNGEAVEKTVPTDDDMDAGFRKNGTLYPTYESPGIHWGMSIDMNSCIGCGACVVGCQAENNVSVVGKDHVLKVHEMSWIRIDRYFSGMPDDPDSIQTVFQPMLCQHCDNAPCENVCPVSATNHSSEGLNQMIYNRCIGTKYCANNCPFKVRRFNWMDWNGADCFEDNQYEDYRRDDMNDDLTRMVLNPDVTVRSRGVMEKCTFCVQRLQDAKLTAKKDDRPLKDGEARTACQQACPADAIVFGNVNDKESAIYKLRTQQQRERLFYALEEIHVLPNVNYLAKVRNTDEIHSGDESKDEIFKYHI